MNSSYYNNKILLIDKPGGLTSFRVIDVLRRGLGIKKAGHSGTLDKFATGLLVVCTGFATRLTRFFLENDKHYTAEIRLGIETDTCDPEGKIISENRGPYPDINEITEALEDFRGDIMQAPPVYSALKINGRRSSDLARAGKEPDIKKRPVTVRRLDVADYKQDKGLLTVDVECSKGTYIRALARDLGGKLGTGASLSALRRTASGAFSVSRAAGLEEILNPGFPEAEAGFILNPIEALKEYGLIEVKNSAVRTVSNGAMFKRDDTVRIHAAANGIYSVISGNELLALASVDVKSWDIKYLNVFNG